MNFPLLLGTMVLGLFDAQPCPSSLVQPHSLSNQALCEDVEQLKQSLAAAEAKLRSTEADRGQKKVARDEAHDKVSAAHKELLAAKRAKNEAAASTALGALREAQRDFENAKNLLKVADDEVRHAKAEVRDLSKRLVKAQREAKRTRN